MMNPDQIYTVRQLQHHDLRAEAAAYRVEQKCAHQRAAGRHTWLARWLRRLVIRRLRGVTVTE